MRTSRLFIKEVKSGNVSRVKHMLEDDPKLAFSSDKTGLSAIMVAAYYRQPAIVRLLRQRLSKLSLHEATAVGDVSVLTRFLSTALDNVEATAPDGLALLHIAVGLEHCDVIDVLLRAGADVNRRSENSLRHTPMHIAIENNSTACIEALLAAGADPNARQHDGWTPLHLAARTGNIPVARLLLEHGAKPDALDERERTPGEIVPDHARAGWQAMLEDAAVTTSAR